MSRALWACMLALSGLACRAEPDARAIALNCLTCHDTGVDAGAGGIPGLDTFSPESLERALLNFKYDRKQATLMPRLVKGYSDDELRAVAVFLTLAR